MAVISVNDFSTVLPAARQKGCNTKPEWRIAAIQIGLLHSGGSLGYYRAKEILREEFDRRNVDDVNWSLVNEAFQNGRSAVISTTELKQRYFPDAGNDNTQTNKKRFHHTATRRPFRL
jgi:hypothetical protein